MKSNDGMEAKANAIPPTTGEGDGVGSPPEEERSNRSSSPSPSVATASAANVLISMPNAPSPPLPYPAHASASAFASGSVSASGASRSSHFPMPDAQTRQYYYHRPQLQYSHPQEGGREWKAKENDFISVDWLNRVEGKFDDLVDRIIMRIYNIENRFDHQIMEIVHHLNSQRLGGGQDDTGTDNGAGIVSAGDHVGEVQRYAAAPALDDDGGTNANTDFNMNANVGTPETTFDGNVNTTTNTPGHDPKKKRPQS